MANDALIDRLRKVLALAQAGEGGERENAERQLAAMLKKHGLMMEDITEPEECVEEIEARFTWSNEYHYRVAVQVIARVLNKSRVNSYTYKGKPKVLCVLMPKPLAIEAMLQYDIYSDALDRTLSRATSALIHANMIFPDVKNENAPELTQEERAEMHRMMGMMDSVERPSIHKALPGIKQ